MLFDVALENTPVADLGSINYWRYEGVAGVGTDSELPRKCGRSAVGLVGNWLLRGALHSVQPVFRPSVCLDHRSDRVDLENTIVASNEVFA